jgi:hypothetical protein
VAASPIKERTMHRTLTLLALALLGAGIYGCGGDDDDDSGATGGTGGSAGSSSATGGAAGSSAPAVTCTPAAGGAGGAGAGACLNTADCPIVEGGTARTAAQSCGLGCMSDADPETCSANCVASETGLSTECATCYSDLVGCTMQNCLADCAADPAAAACTDCQMTSGCRTTFDECSGLQTAT